MRQLLIVFLMMTLTGAIVSCEDNFSDQLQSESDATLEAQRVRYPDIEVRLDSSNSPVEADSTILLGSSSHNIKEEKTFRIYNNGEGTLTLTGTLVSVTDTFLEFDITSSPAIQIPSGSSTTFSVMYTPDYIINDGGERNALVTIHNNDPDQGEFSYTINYEGVNAPTQEIKVKYVGTNMVVENGASFDLGSTYDGQPSITKNFLIYNAGGDTLSLTDSEITLSSATTEFIFDILPSSLELGNSGSTDFSIRFISNSATYGIGIRTATITVYSSDYTQPEYSISLTINVSSGPQPEINLVQGTNQLPNGTGIYKFKPEPVGGSSSGDVPFTIENLGTALLSISSIIELSGDTGNFYTTGSISSVSAGSNASFNIDFIPASAGWKTMVMRINSDDSDENPYEFTVKGGGIDEITNLAGVNYDYYGRSVDISSDGNFAIVGAYGEDSGGGVYILKRDAGTGVWSQMQILTGTGVVAGDGFGFSTAIDGNFAIVGAPYSDRNGYSNTGSIYFYYYNGATWNEHAIYNGGDDDYLGYSVDIEASSATSAKAVAGAYQDDYLYNKVTYTDVGSVKVYTCGSSTCSGYKSYPMLTHQAYGPQDYDYFGYSVAMSNNIIVVGARSIDYSASVTNSGAAFVFNLSNSLYRYKLNPEQPASSDYFGHSVAINGNNIFVGAPYDDDNGTNSGSVTHFYYKTIKLISYWTRLGVITPDDPDGNQVYDYFGLSLSLDNDATGNTLVVGAYTDDEAGGANSNYGAVYVYRNTVSTTWNLDTKIIPDNTTLYYGYDVAYDGNNEEIFVGAFGENTYTGKVYILPY